MSENNNENTWQRTDISGTPYSIMKSDKGECKIVVGNNLMTERTFISEKAAKKYIFGKPWELILNTMALMATNIFNNLKNTQEQ